MPAVGIEYPQLPPALSRDVKETINAMLDASCSDLAIHNGEPAAFTATSPPLHDNELIALAR